MCRFACWLRVGSGEVLGVVTAVVSGVVFGSVNKINLLHNDHEHWVRRDASRSLFQNCLLLGIVLILGNSM